MASGFDESGADLELIGVTKRFPGFTAVDDLNLTVPAGSFFALLGPSGCGKTTTLRLVGGLEEPTAGRVLIGGKDVTNTKPHQRPVNTVFQSYALFPHMTVLANVEFGLRRRGVSDARLRALEALRLVELEHLANRRPNQLSGGQQQRVALARAVVNRPALLLLDEPLGALDLKLRRQMQLELKDIQHDVGLTFLHVTHDQEEAMTMADTVAVMNKGRIEQMGAPEELYELPRTAFVANFLGQSNLFTGEVISSESSSIVVDIAGRKLEVPRERAQRHSGEVTIGVRPEKLTLHTSAPVATSGVNVIGPGRVNDVSFSGVSTQYQIGVPGLGNLVLFAQNTSFGPVVNDGAEVWLSWKVEHGFGLADEPGEAVRFDPDDDTREIAMVQRKRLEAELEGGLMAFGAFASTGPTEQADVGRRRKSFVALLLLLPGVIYLALTFVAPLIALIATAFKEPGGTFDVGEYVYAFRWENFTEALSSYGEILGRTFVYAGLATLFALIISYPLAYFIGVKLRRYPLWQALALILVIAPFFISFLLRTLAWKQIFSDEGVVVTALQALSLLPPDAHVTGTPFMVVFGLTYNFIPFMCLPIYASLERLDLRYVEAGSDLYAPPTQRFLRIILPLSLPGVISGVLLVFIPASGDFINAAKEFLGSVQTTMAGNVINDLFFQSVYPVSAAMSIILMVITLIPVAVYVARSGSEELL